MILPMKRLFPLSFCLALFSCEGPSLKKEAVLTTETAPVEKTIAEVPAADLTTSVMRINSVMTVAAQCKPNAAGRYEIVPCGRLSSKPSARGSEVFSSRSTPPGFCQSTTGISSE